MKVLDKTMVEYILEYVEDESGSMSNDFISYAEFLSQEIELEMFVPYKDGFPLSEPINPNLIDPQPDFGQEDYDRLSKIYNEYQEAKQKVLFEGDWKFDRDDRYHWAIYLIDKSKKRQ